MKTNQIIYDNADNWLIFNNADNLTCVQTVKEKLHKTNFISILCDSSTDSAVVEKECINILFADLETFDQTISFFSLRYASSQDAEGIFSALTDEWLEHPLKNVVFLVSDRAKQM